MRGFGLLWNDQPVLAQSVGCPQATEVGLSARVQVFENGMMIWLDTVTPGIDKLPWVLTMIDSTASRYRVPADGSPWVDGAVEPSGGFKWVWNNVFTDRERLGAPVDAWYGSDAALQIFDAGTMIWLKTPPDGGKPMIYVVRADLLAASSATYRAYPDLSAQ